MINVEDFAKLDIKVGEILEVEKIPDTNKLLKLKVDLGGNIPRDIVSGIVTFFEDINDLVGKQIPILSNLEPRIIKGHTSNGMILAASETEVFSLLVTEKKLLNGSWVRRLGLADKLGF